jgi:uracil-DNA glycosylase family 4
VTLAERIVACRRCPRLIAHARRIAREKRRAYRDQTYWGRPVPPLGSRSPRLLVVGLAPGAHGANRTGRVFTGDSSGEWLFRALHAAGFANRPESIGPRDGLLLREAAVTCAVRCAPPGNRPRPEEREACLPFLVEELSVHRRLRVILALGRFAFDAVLRAARSADFPEWRPKPAFGHGTEWTRSDGRIVLLGSYHPSRQNTQTGRLSRAMFQGPVDRAREILDADS